MINIVLNYVKIRIYPVYLEFLSPSLRGFPLTLAPAQVDLPEIRYECDKKLILPSKVVAWVHVTCAPGGYFVKNSEEKLAFEIETLKE